MKTTLALLSIGILTLCAGLQPERARAQDADAVAPVANDPSPKKAPPTSKPKSNVMKTKCYTSERDCAGNATFGGFQQDMGCSIWWNNGANGRTNFNLRAGEVQTRYARYNDVGACVRIQYAPPKDQPRFYIYVNG